MWWFQHMISDYILPYYIKAWKKGIQYDKHGEIYDESYFLCTLNFFMTESFSSHRLCFLVTHALSIISILLMTGLIIFCVNVIVICWVLKRTPGYDGLYWVLCHLFWFHMLLLNLLLSVTIGHVQSHASMYRLNWFLLLTQHN